MRKKKIRIRGILITLAVLALAGAGGAYGVRRYLAGRETSVEVYPVSQLNGADWLSYYNETTTSGMIVSDVSQNVYVPEDKVVNEVYVSQGDKVKIGDKLLDYDTTLLELDRELQDLELQELDLEIESAEADLKKLNNTTPVAYKPEEDDLMGPDLSLPEDFDGDYEARMISGGRTVLGSQDGDGAQSGTDEKPAGDVQEQGAEAPVTEAPVQETELQTGAEAETSGGKEPSTEARSSTQAEEKKPSVEDGEQLITEQMDPGGASSGDGYIADDFFTDGGGMPDGQEKPRMHQSLRDLLTHIRVKQETSGEEEEELIADTRKEEETDKPVTAQITAAGINLVPHFAEKADAHFERLNTYTLLIWGITLKEEKAGKLYGIAAINGEDYPEIGGYTLTQDPDDDDVVLLTLAFHDGLEEQHELAPELEDMYAEIPLSLEELVRDELIFRTEKKENDTHILLEKPEPDDAEPSSGDETDAPETEEPQETENVETDAPQSDAQGGDDGPAQESNSGDLPQESESGDLPQEGGSNDPWGGESEPGQPAEPETEGEQQVYGTRQILFDIIWYHGTNEEALWPHALSIDFYDGEDDAQEHSLWSTTVPKDNAPEEQPGTDAEPQTENPEGDGRPEKETELPAEPQTGAGDADDVPEMDLVVEGEIEHVISSEENTYSSTHMKAYRSWQGMQGEPDDYLMVVRAVDSINYIPRIEWGAADAQGTRVCTVTMKYLEPEESPLVKLEPLSELTYWTGAGKRYYKGSGTKDDPYVFFCTDGAEIKNTFVNWVLGFDEDGTERERDGCYVLLEIRESDTITGAFIRSVGLDGTIRMDYGYGPGTYWVFASDSGITRFEEDIPDPDEDMDIDDPGWMDWGETYTAEELALAIKEKEREIRRLNLDKKEGEMKLRQYDRDMEESTVVSAVDGYVKSMGGGNGEAYMVVTSQEGLYLRTAVSELDLGNIKKGDILKGTSWESGAFTASVTEVSYYPSSSDEFYSYGGGQNPNSSNYPVLARIEDNDALSPYENVEVQFQQQSGQSGGVYITVMYVRSENGQSYVYKVDENGLLKKQYVRTGRTIDGYLEIKEGLSNDDYIAFPYGKAVKDGAKTKSADDDGEEF